MTVYLVVLLSVLNSIGQRGSKVAVSLYALELGGGSFTVGLLAAMFAAFPLLLAVHAGRISDRVGVGYPIRLGTATMACGLALPALAGGLPALFLCPALIGLGHIFFHVSIHNLVGSLGAAEDRTRNFATFALGGSIAAFAGPSLAGFGIEIAGYRATFAMLAVIGFVPALIVLLHKALIPAHARHEEETAKSALDLLANAALGRSARHAPDGEQGDADRRAARLRRIGRAWRGTRLPVDRGVSPGRRRAVAARASQSGVNSIRMAEPGSPISNKAGRCERTRMNC